MYIRCIDIGRGWVPSTLTKSRELSHFAMTVSLLNEAACSCWKICRVWRRLLKSVEQCHQKKQCKHYEQCKQFYCRANTCKQCKLSSIACAASTVPHYFQISCSFWRFYRLKCNCTNLCYFMLKYFVALELFNVVLLVVRFCVGGLSVVHAGIFSLRRPYTLTLTHCTMNTLNTYTLTILQCTEDT